MTLVVANKGPTAVQLEADSPLGGVVPVEEVQSDELKTSGKEEVSEPELCKDTDHGRVCVIKSHTGRRQELLGQLDMKIRHLTQPQRATVEDFILEYADVFALTSNELGTTPLAEHTINTGDQTPIPQPARRMPFSLRDQVDQLAQEMLTQGVVVHQPAPGLVQWSLSARRTAECASVWTIVS